MSERRKFKAVCSIVERYCVSESSQMRMDSDLTELGVNNLAITELLLEVEEAFEVEFPSDAYLSIRTIGNIVAYL